MSALINFSLDLSKLPKNKIVQGKKGQYINLTASVNDDSRFGNNVSVFVGQSKEERENKTAKTYVANGQVVWTDGNIVVAEKEQEAVTATSSDDLPF